MTALSEKLAPVLSEHEDNISLNEKLFKRKTCLSTKRLKMNLTTEQKRLLDKTYKQLYPFRANLSAEKANPPPGNKQRIVYTWYHIQQQCTERE